ncbi:MAG TPA: glycosyltransferase family 87 protein [Anaerolineales bacterium]|jgi:hypothetical protein
MKLFFTFFASILAAGLAILAISFLAPLPILYYQDFSVMYLTNKGLISGIPIYSYAEQLNFVKMITPPGFTFHPYPYPPWYALATLFLGLLPIQVAARVWFFVNLAMLILSDWLLTPGWKGTRRILVFFAAIMFVPTFGLLVVGQYSVPVLLGAALFIYAARIRSPIWLAVALILMTFKPHIGGLLFLGGFAWLLFDRSSQAKRALVFTIAGGLGLAAIGFVADPVWPLAYFQSLTSYRNIPGVQTCDLCASLSVALVKLATGQSSTYTAALLSLVLALLAAWLLFGRLRALLKIPAALMSLMALLTLLLDPYLLNYDYILLLLPLFWLVRREKLAWGIYLLPWLALVIGREGNVLLAFAGLVTFILILIPSIDAFNGEA